MQLPKTSENCFTYADYATWDDDERWELIDGVPYLMSPAPNMYHQEILMNLGGLLHAYLKGKRCKVFPAPFDVRLDADTTDDTVVQPDLSVVCDPAKLANGKNCVGAPDLVVEILSPSTAQRDRILKFNKYQEAGVREYWMIDPRDRVLTVHLLKGGEYVSKSYGATDTVRVGVLEDCAIPLAEVFPALEA